MLKILKKEKVSKTSKRHFTVVIGNKEHGLYVSSTPSLAAKKAISKLCASNKNKKVEFHIREITQGSKKKTYGPYIGHIEKLDNPIKLKEYIIKYNPVVKLKVKTGAKKGGMRRETGTGNYLRIPEDLPNSEDFKSEITPNNISNTINHTLSKPEHEHKKKLMYLNKALTYIGIEKCLMFFGKFLSNFNDKLPIISVGSGTAYFEFLIHQIFRRDIVCVDPDPKSYTPTASVFGKSHNVFIKPEFKTVNKLLSARNHDCLLLLNWPNPMFKSNLNYDPYDFNAIIKLKPIGFFIVYETEHGSGSDNLIEVLKGSHNSNIIDFKISEEETISYKLLDVIEKIEQFQGITNHYRIAYYRRKKVRNISTLFSNHNFFGNN